MDAQMTALLATLNAIPAKYPRQPRAKASPFHAVVEYPRRDPKKTIRPFITDTGIPCGNWFEECHQSAHRYGKTGPVWVGD